MPLQIRRGTTAQRLSITPLVGEPIYDTELQTVFIGDGITPGGVSAITGLTNEDVVDAAGTALEAGQHESIVFTYTGLPDAANRIDARVDLSDYTGEIKATNFRGPLFADDSSIIIDSATSFITAANVSATVISSSNFIGPLSGDVKGSVFGDNSTSLVNAVDNSINLDGTVKGNIIPDINVAYDIGSATFRFKDLWLSGTSINLGGAVITASGSVVDLPVGSTVGGVAIGSGGIGGDGVISGNNYRINITGADSAYMVNSDEGTISAANGFTGNLTGNVLGDVVGDVFGSLKGSVFGGDSSILYDADLSHIYLSGNVASNIEPHADSTYDLGDALFKFRDLHLSSRIYLGSSQINSVGTTVDLPLNSTVNSDIILTGSSITVDIIDGDGNIMIDSSTRNIFAGSVVADLVGSVIGDSSVVLVDATNNTLSNGVIVLQDADMLVNAPILNFGNADFSQATTFKFFQPAPTTVIDVLSNTNGTYAAGIVFNAGRDDLDVPNTVQSGDPLFTLAVTGHDGTSYNVAGGITFKVDADAAMGIGTLPGAMIITVFDDNTEANKQKSIYMDSRGWVGIRNGSTKPQATLDINGFAKLAILGTAPATPANGMVAIADGTGWDPLGAAGKQQMVVYLGGAWRSLAQEP